MQFHVDGTEGSAVAGLRHCRVQHRATTPRPVWNPDEDQPDDFRAQWQLVPPNGAPDNGFRVQWEQFLTHVVTGAPWTHDFRAGARGVQLAEAGWSPRARAAAS